MDRRDDMTSVCPCVVESWRDIGRCIEEESSVHHPVEKVSGTVWHSTRNLLYGVTDDPLGEQCARATLFGWYKRRTDRRTYFDGGSTYGRRRPGLCVVRALRGASSVRQPVEKVSGTVLARRSRAFLLSGCTYR